MDEASSQSTKTRPGTACYQALLDMVQETAVGSYLPAERELAARLGVSHGTVRRALARLANEGQIEKVHGKGNVVLASKCPQLRPVIYADDWSDMTHPFCAAKLRGLMDGAQAFGFGLQIVNCANDRQALFQALNQERLAAVVVSNVGWQFVAAIRAAIGTLPMIVGVRTDGECSVEYDFTALGSDAVRYLAGLGAKHIGFVGCIDEVLVGARLAASTVANLKCTELSFSPLHMNISQAVDTLISAGVDGLAFEDDRTAATLLPHVPFASDIPVISHANAGDNLLPESCARLEVDGYAVGKTTMFALSGLLNGSLAPSDIRIRPTLKEPK